MKTGLMVTMCLWVGVVLSSRADDLTGMSGRQYYKVHPMFHPFPDEKLAQQSIDRFGPVGIGINLLQPAFKMQVKNVEEGSPAAATGRLKAGQTIDSINGRVMEAKITFAGDGRTDDPLLYYTGDLLLHLNTNLALKMSVKTVGGVEYLFIESGGFDAKKGPNWKPGVIAMKRGYPT